MPATSSSSLRYPSSSDAPNVPSKIQDLALDLDRKVCPAFSTIAARDTQIPSPTQGQTCTVGGTLHVYEGTLWRWNKYSFVSGGVTDVSGHMVVPHGLGIAPIAVLCTPGNQATDLLERVLSMNVGSWDSANMTFYAHRTDTSAVLPTQVLNFSWMALR
jgi:hypothetical protein